ncbi:MAG: thioredoxin [Gaiellales bacterium]
MSSAIEVTQSTFQTEVLQSDVPVLVDLWAAWCGPCRMVGPIVDELGVDYAGRLKVAKVDVDAEPELAQAFGVSSIPTILLFKDGEIVASAIGARPKAQLAAALGLDQHVAAAA